MRVQSSCRLTQPLGIDDRCLFDEDSRFFVGERDRWPETRRAGVRRGGRDEHSAEAEELIRLDYDRIASTSLLVPARSARSGEPEDFAADH